MYRCYNTIMYRVIDKLFPRLDAPYTGPIVLFVFLILLTIVNTARSLVHIFAPDGGAQSIAGIAIDVDGGSNIIAIFGQWGATQLLLALVCWVIIVRYRALVPLAFLLLFTEQVLRLVAGLVHPVMSGHTPPGTIGTYVFIPVLAIALVWSLVVRKKTKKT